uniref:Uncharacterized protein n=1 Tax=Panagrolaimus davidi TaxID=227884 RepID=A0A914QA19_9BILA
MILYFDDGRKFCYDYIRRESEDKYQCCECKNLKKYVHATPFNQKCENEYLELCSRKHICKPKETSSLTVLKSNKIIKKPKYEISEGLSNGNLAKRLILFLDDERKICYNYLFEKLNNCFKCIACLRLKKTIRAVLYNPGTDVEYLDLFAKEHFCEPKEYQLLPILKKSEIIKKPKYDLTETISKRILVKHLVVFVDNNDDDEKKLCYDYYRDNSVKKYKCCGCKSLTKEKSTMAAIFNLNSEKECVDLLGYQHFCEPQNINH